MFKVFWREEDLNKQELRLLNKLMEAHHHSCFRDNASSTAVAISADASGDMGKAIVAGISTMGAKHAPVEQTAWLLWHDNPAWKANLMLEQYKRIPGWGGHFQKDGPDPLWVEVADLIRLYYPALHSKLETVTEKLREHGKMIYPNPSAYTACVAIALGMPSKLAPCLFLYGRLAGWAEIASHRLMAAEIADWPKPVYEESEG
jgi:citrate synthase